jgi:hypothetical protein
MNLAKSNDVSNLGYAKTGNTEAASEAAARLLAVPGSKKLTQLKPIIIKKILIQPYFDGQTRPDRIVTFGPAEIDDPKRLQEIACLNDVVLWELRNSEAITAI